MKSRHISTLLLAALFAAACGIAYAQNETGHFSLMPYAGLGYGGDPGIMADAPVFYLIALGGADARYAISPHWSLLSGLEYQYRLTKGTAVGADGLEIRDYTKKEHVLHVPLLLEYRYRWFYAQTGPYAEFSFDRITGRKTRELGIFGGELELGAAIPISEQGCLRAGLRMESGKRVLSNGHIWCWNFNSMVRIGYEHTF